MILQEEYDHEGEREIGEFCRRPTRLRQVVLLGPLADEKDQRSDAMVQLPVDVEELRHEMAGPEQGS